MQVRRERAQIATMAVGLIVFAEQANANEFVASKAADLVAIGRAALHSPNWPLHAREALDDAAGFSEWPLQFGWWLARRKPVLEAAIAVHPPWPSAANRSHFARAIRRACSNPRPIRDTMTMLTRRRLFLSASAALATAALVRPAHAQGASYPAKPIQVKVAFALAGPPTRPFARRPSWSSAPWVNP